MIERHVIAAARLHGDDTTVPILARAKTDTGRAWVYVRDDRPFGGADPPAVLFRASRDRSGDHPHEHLTCLSGILQADAYAGYNWLLVPDRQPGPIVEALCWAHARRKFFELADIAANRRRGRNAAPISPIAFPDPEWDSLRDRTYSAKATKLGALIDRGVTKLSYIYDFDDTWRHMITIEATVAADPAMDYPRHIDGKRRAPPEDLGGLPGFELFLEAIADPSHEEHDELMRWHGAPFDQDVVDEQLRRLTRAPS